MEGKLNLLSDLSNDFGRLLSSGDNYDVIIKAGEGQNMKKFFAHSLILGERSMHFKSTLSKERTKKDDEVIIFKIPNISPDTFELLLKYLYTGMVDLDDQNGVQVLKLYRAADELNLRELNDYIRPYLISNQAKYLRHEPVEILQIVLQYETFEDLRNYCLENICKSPKVLFESPKFTLLGNELIIPLLMCDLEMEEIVIWNYILKWGMSKMSTRLDVDNISRWTLDYFKELERILHELIPLIRWFQISAKDFWRKVSPFEQIFPKQLYKDIIGHYLDPETPPISVILSLRSNNFRLD
ncbi:14709_t:CDS:1 [Funneliformis geosporum]|nr:14709_t:CDS:1 [Funneliformis geosporum]